MSGHSKWSTIKRKKEVTDIARGKLFSKLTRAITLAIKAGGGSDPKTNYKLRIAIDDAKANNMPKENIERAISRASASTEDFNEVTYEGFGPEGAAVLVQAATDNRNRTAQELKNIFEKNGGNMGSPGSVSFNFEPKGLVLVEKQGSLDDMMLALIDLGVDDLEDTPDGVELYVSYDKLNEISEKINEQGFVVKQAEFIQKPKNVRKIEDAETGRRLLKLLSALEDNDDVQKVFADIQLPQEVLESSAES